jgi:hypothetical protein
MHFSTIKYFTPNYLLHVSVWLPSAGSWRHITETHSNKIVLNADVYQLYKLVLKLTVFKVSQNVDYQLLQKMVVISFPLPFVLLYYEQLLWFELAPGLWL